MNPQIGYGIDDCVGWDEEEMDASLEIIFNLIIDNIVLRSNPRFSVEKLGG